MMLAVKRISKISTLATEKSEDYGWNALGVVTGTVGTNVISKINFGNKYGNQVIKPLFSNYTGEYLGNFEQIKLKVKDIKGDTINEENK